MSEFRKPILRSSLLTDDCEQDKDYKTLETSKQLIDELLYIYYGYDASFLPYTHDEIITENGKQYRYNPKAGEAFIDDLINTIDEQYWRNFPLPDELFDKFNDDTIQFYRAFLYLAIRIASIKITVKKPEGHHEDVGNGTFRDLITLTHSLCVPYSERGFHRRFEIGIPDNKLPNLFFDIQTICRALGKENSFLHTSTSAEEQETAYREDSEEELNHIRMISYEQGIDIDQLKASEQYLKETAQFYRNKENEDLMKQLKDFEDADTFIMKATTYRDLLFRYNTHGTEEYIETALKLFLLRNRLSVLSTEDGCKKSHKDISSTIDKLREIKDNNNM